MKKVLLLCSIATLLFACGSDVVRMSNAEEIYGTRINNAESDGTYILLAKASPMLDTLGAPVASGAIAIANYNALSEEQQKNHKETTVQIESSTAAKRTFDFANDVVILLSEKDKAFQTFTEAFVKQDKDALRNMSDPKAVTEGDLSVLKVEMGLMEDKFGSLNGYRLIGVGVYTDNVGEMIQMHGQLMFDDQDVFYMVAFDKAKGNTKFVAYTFRF